MWYKFFVLVIDKSLNVRQNYYSVVQGIWIALHILRQIYKGVVCGWEGVHETMGELRQKFICS